MVGEAIAGRREEVFLVSKVMPSNASYEGTPRACERLVADGKIRSWGVSNFDVEALEGALAIAGPGRIACNQVLYHLQERAMEHGVLPWCEAHGVAVVGYSPLGSGSFPRPTSHGGRVLAELARAHGASPYQVALRFLVRRPSLFTIPKASSEGHVRDNAAAAALKLSSEELARIDAAFPLASEPAELPVI